MSMGHSYFVQRYFRIVPRFVMLVCALLSERSFAQDSELIEFEAAPDFEAANMQSIDKAASDKLAGLGAVVVDMKNFPATFISKSKIDAVSFVRCTATAIGPKVVIIAAHCIKGEGKISLPNGRSAACTVSKKYNPNSKFGRTADYALCEVGSPFPGSMLFESVLTDSMPIKIYSLLLLSGFGCTTKNPPTYDRTFRVGFASVRALPSGNSNDIVTDWDGVFADNGQGAALCSGDSGGAAYFVPANSDLSHRQIVAVNSRSDMTCIYGPNPDGGCIDDFATIDGRSYLSSLATSDARAFFKEWVYESHSGIEVCGYNLSDERCRK